MCHVLAIDYVEADINRGFDQVLVSYRHQTTAIAINPSFTA